jgi:hypothetical protein
VILQDVLGVLHYRKSENYVTVLLPQRFSTMCVYVCVCVWERERESGRVKASYNAITSKHLYIQEYETSIDTLVVVGKK